MYHWPPIMGFSPPLLLATACLLVAAHPLAGPTLGPVDGLDLPAKALDRIPVGQTAPDFLLSTQRGEMYRLSDERGVRDIVLVFYRGHW